MGIERNGVLKQLRTLFSAGTIRDLTDGQLLERFATDRGEAAEQAFSTLVERHGPMVLRVCRGVLVDPHDTQDAFQATFLVPVKKARALWVRDSLGPWLHQVAFRTASCARAAAARRRRHERCAAAAKTSHSEVGDELGRVLHEEIERLPERFRAPLVLCDLEGRTHEQAARHLGWPVGTVKSRQSRGRERLRQRLLRRGLGSNTALIGPSVLVPPALVDSTTSAVVQFVMARAIVEGSAASLAQGVLRSMFITRWLKVASVLLVAGATASGVELLVQEGLAGVKAPAQEKPRAAKIDDRPVQEVKPGKIRFEVSERGSLEPSRARDAYCLVEGSTTIISLRPDGSQVKKGDLVCELDSASLRDILVYQQITTKSAERAYQQAKLASEIAGIAVTDYVEAILKLERRNLKITIASAQTAVHRADVRLAQTRRARGRVKDASATKAGAATPSDVVAELDIEDRVAAAEQALARERKALEQARDKLELFENSGKETTEERKQELVRKRSAEQVKLSIVETQKNKEAQLHKQIEKCKFYASIDGRIVHANDPGRNFGNRPPEIEEGATVRERQKIFSLMPFNDPMQVNTKVHESKIDNVKAGMKAQVRVDAFPDRTLSATVKDVAPLPDPTSIFRSDIKVYTVHVTIDEPLSGLRPGMTALVEIFGDERDNVLTVPVQGVLRFDGKDHVAVKKPDGGFDWRDVSLGLSNEKIVEIKQGLRSGDVVALDPFALMSEEEKRQKFGSPPRPADSAVRKNAPR
jgi:RND family efflux transporter MFP subunit